MLVNSPISMSAKWMILTYYAICTVYGSFMQLAGIQNETVDLEVLKSPQVVASYVKFTDINIQTSVTKPLASIKCSENSSELKQENIEQSKDDSNVK